MNLIKMIDDFNKSSKGKIFKSFFALFVSIVMLVTVCLAYSWFVKNKNIASSGMVITSKNDEVHADFSSYYIEDIDTKTVLKGQQYNNANGMPTLDMNMLPYDVTFTSVNQYAAIVLRVLIYDIPEEFIPAQNQTKYVSLVISRNTSLSPASNNELDAYFSTIGQIGCYANSTLSLTDSNQDIYDAVITQYRADQNIMKFTTSSNSTYTKVSHLNRSIPYTTANFKTDSNNKSCLVLYMCFDYNATLAQEYASQEIDSLASVNSLEQKYDMVSDISGINVDFN